MPETIFFPFAVDSRLHIFIRESHLGPQGGDDEALVYAHQVFCPIIASPNDTWMNILVNPTQHTFRSLMTNGKFPSPDGQQLGKPVIFFGENIGLDDQFMFVGD